ncbi:Os01g0660100, partial [Oryza sativa Japonica Group]
HHKRGVEDCDKLLSRCWSSCGGDLPSQDGHTGWTSAGRGDSSSL